MIFTLKFFYMYVFCLLNATFKNKYIHSEDEEVLYMDGTDGCTIMRIYPKATKLFT